MNDENFKIYPTKAMYKFGGGNKNAVYYDFSILNADCYDAFFNTLPNMIYKKCKLISLSCDMEYKINNQIKANPKKLETYKNSIAYKKPEFINHIIKILRKTLVATKNLKSLEISSINISSDLLMKLLEAIGSNITLESVSFININITDMEFQYFLSVISPFQYKTVSFINCPITSFSFPSIVKFINQTAPKRSKKVRKLSEFIVDNCNFTIDELNIIQQLVNEAQPEIPETPNPNEGSECVGRERVHVTIQEAKERSISESDTLIPQEDNISDSYEKRSVRASMYYSQVKSYKSKSSKKHHEKVNPLKKDFDVKSTAYSTVSTADLPNYVPYCARSIRSTRNTHQEESYSSSDSESLFELEIDRMENPGDLSNEELKKQNKELEIILRKFMDKYNVTKYSDDCFIVGKGSKELLKSIKLLKKQIQTYNEIKKSEAEKKEGLSSISIPLDD